MGRHRSLQEMERAPCRAYKVSPSIDGSSDVDTLEKIFDLNQQLAGKLEPYRRIGTSGGSWQRNNT